MFRPIPAQGAEFWSSRTCAFVDAPVATQRCAEQAAPVLGYEISLHTLSLLKKIATMVAINKYVAGIAFGLAIAAVASPSLAQRSENGNPMSSAREQALRECNGVAGKMSQYVWGDQQIQAYRACMAQHGQQE